MRTIFDVADWFLSKEPMTHKKLQKLCYYYKAWGLALYDEDLLPDSEFQAWAHGPVNPELYALYHDRHWQDIDMKPDNSELFSPRELELLESVWYTYGDMTANALEVRTHKEAPWLMARGDLDELAVCTNVITNESMRDYYAAAFERFQGE